MSTGTITCTDVDERDLDTRYLSGDLTATETEEFEAHFFGCERCWTLVQHGLDVRAGLEQVPAAAPSTSREPHLRGPPRWLGLAAAAGIAVAALGIWSTGLLTGPGRQADALRGDSPALLVASTQDAGGIRAAWPRMSEADLYRVRLYAGDGSVVLERETADTSISVGSDELPAQQRSAELFWQVQALDPLRNTIARSDLTRANSPAP